MKKTILLLLALTFSFCAVAQTKTSGLRQDGMGIDTTMFVRNRWHTQDTVAVIAYCVDVTTLKTQWRKLYAIQGWNYPSIDMNGLMLYQSYLMPDRKSPVTYKVIYSIKL